MKKLSKEEMKRVIGGQNGGDYCGSNKINGCCNTYCGTGAGVTCTGSCGNCSDAGNGRNPNIPGGDKLCFSSVSGD